MLFRPIKLLLASEVDKYFHPIDVVGALRENYGGSLVLQFSRYAYKPQTIFDERETFDVLISEVTLDWLQNEITSLQSGWELALNSRVVDQRRRTLHIPMIDFVGRHVLCAYSAFEGVLGSYLAKRMMFFDSGRSFHAYSPVLIAPGDWVDFMGRLLLLNPPGDQPVTDARWIGHRLMGGFSALRWSNNSGAYVGLPVAVPRESVFGVEKLYNNS